MVLIMGKTSKSDLMWELRHYVESTTSNNPYEEIRYILNNFTVFHRIGKLLSISFDNISKHLDFECAYVPKYKSYHDGWYIHSQAIKFEKVEKGDFGLHIL